MKFYLILALLFACPSLAMGETHDISAPEDSSAKVCGDLLIGVGSIWVSEGETKVTLYTHGDLRSKPMSGGYRHGDSVEIGYRNNCKYYVHSILKQGRTNSPGTVVFSKRRPPLLSKSSCPQSEEMLGKVARVLKVGDVTWINSCAYRVEKVRDESAEMKDKVSLKKLDHYLPDNSNGIPGSDNIPGEWMNQPDLHNIQKTKAGSQKS